MTTMYSIEIHYLKYTLHSKIKLIKQGLLLKALDPWVPKDTENSS